MKLFKLFLIALLSMVAGGMQSVYAQTAVTVGSQVTDASNIVSGKAYLLQHQGNGTNTPWLEDAGTYYNCPNSAGNCNLASVWYLIDNGDGTWKIENAYTGKYWPKPTGNANLVGTDAASAGSWALNFSSGVAAPTCNGYRLNRNTPNLVGWNSGSGSVTQVKIYEVTASTLSTAATYSAFTDKDISVSATEAASISEGQWYVMSQRSRTSYVFENTSDHKLKHTLTKPSGSATEKAGYLVRLLSADGGKYYLQNGFGNYMGTIAASTNVPTTALGQEAITVAKIGGTDGHFYLQGTTNSVILDGNDFTLGDPSTVAGWGTDTPSTTGGNNDWAFYPVDFVDSWVPTISEVYTINNTNSNRGAIMYNGSSSYVWSSGKSGTFSATDPNCQWVLVPTGTANQYYLYNVGAGKFAIPSGTGSTASWIFSSDAVAVKFITQNDGTKKIKTVTTDTYAAVSNGYNGPIINYNDVGGNFTITKVDGDQSTAATAAFNKLVDNQTAASAVPASGSDGWYIIRIKTHGTYADKYVFPAASEINYSGTYYPLTFEHGANVRPAIDDVTYYTRISNESGNYYWQMPNGKYLYGDNNKFPISTMTKSNFAMDYTNGSGFRMWGSSRYAVPYLLGNQFFIGETATAGNAYYDIYPINLSAAGLTAWQAICDNAPDNAQITCSRSDVKGLADVYKNGYFFLPTGVTPLETDFTLEGAYDVDIDATAQTVTFAYDPNLAMVEGSITVAQGWQTAGRDSEVMLLSVTASPFKNATGTTMTVSLKDGAEANISALTLYEADSASPEIYSTGTGAPTKTEVATATVSGSTATFSIGNLSAGTHYYWIGAIVSSTATLGAVIDAAVTGITYTCNDNETTLDLTSVGDPADRGAMVFNTRSYPFLPWDNGSRVYRIPAMVVADDGSIVVACDKRYDSYRDIGGGHVIDIVVRRSTDGGKTWSEPVVVAKGDNSNDATCGYGDPSLIKGNDGKIYCIFGAGNIGYFYGLNRICVSVSEDNGVTWSSSASNPPADLVSTGKLTDHASSYGSNTCYGLYDYFVTSGRGLCTSEGYLMGLLPAQPYTNEGKTEKTSNSHDYIFYSTDKGATWHFSEDAIFVGGDEAKIIQANDGSLLASVRQGGNRGFNTATYTLNNDGTLTFSMGTQWNNSQLNAGGNPNNQDIFYYQRETDEGKTDIIFHSMTTGQHANLKLYYSIDKGRNWTEFLTVQTKGTRYVTMDKNPANGSLYLLFEDQSLNSAGGYTDYNHYPLNFIEITRDQLVQLIPAIDEYQVPDYLETKDVKIVYGTTAHTSYGSLSGNTWTSNASSGVAGMTLTKSGGDFNQFSNWNSHYNLAYKPAAANEPSTLTLTAPEGYLIQGYSLLAAKAYSAEHTYTFTAADGTAITPAFASSATGYTTLTVSNVNAPSTTISVTTTDASKYVAIADFTVTLAKTFPLNVVGDASYATLYLPVDVTTDGTTKAYYVTTTNNGYAQLTATANDGTEIPARTAVVLVNSEAATSTAFTRTSGLSSAVNESTNLLKGTLVPMSLDLSDGTNNYSLGKLNGEIGFYKFSGGTITLGANKAYLEAPAAGGAVKGFTLSFGGEDGILQIENETWTMDNEAGAWYDLNGRKLIGVPAAKGVYIVGGKKVIVK